MMTPSRPAGWRSPPLALQIMGLLLGSLVVAQLVTLLLTLFLPPEPPAKYGIDDIAASIRGTAGTGAGLQREVRDAAPTVSGRGWLQSPTSRDELARLLGVPAGEVTLAFYTPLPFAGMAGPPPAAEPRARATGVAAVDAAAEPLRIRWQAEQPAAWQPAVLVVPPGRPSPATLLRLVQAGQGPGGPGGLPLGMPGGGFPGGPFPGGGMPGGGMRGGGMPGGGLPGGLPGGGLPGGRSSAGNGLPGGLPGGGFPGGNVRGGGIPTGNPPAATVPGAFPGGSPAGTIVRPAEASGVPLATAPIQAGPPAAGGPPGFPSPSPFPTQLFAPPLAGRPTAAPPAAPATSRSGDDRDDARPRVAQAPAAPLPRTEPGARIGPTRADTADAPAADAAPAVTPAPPAAAMPDTGVREVPERRAGLQGAIDRARRLFGLAPTPFVEGDFVAALAQDDGRWLVVQPRSGGLLSPWQKRVALWFLLAWGITAPLGWLFARRLSRPLDRFAEAAARLGRDPSIAITALDGPAEIGRAAHAFNLMQQRLRSFVDDRTAMVGAISHDLRTPLTRMRFRIEDVPDDVRAGLLAEVEEMEEMITSVLAFIRDASAPGARERLDLRTLLEDVVEDAAVVGATVPVEASAPATVEVEVLGMRRVLVNLVENALKYGEHARIRLTVSQDEAIAAVIDDGPGLPDDELEQVFQPFYRTASARASGAPGTGLGLAVCRSIARAHGGDVRLCRSAEGFRAEVRVPLVYEAARAMAA